MDFNKPLVLVNPRLPFEQQQFALQLPTLFPECQNHFLVSTSGTSGKIKWVALSKEAILSSAAAVNKHLNATASDSWIHPLPDFHVAGIGIWARSYLSGSKVFDFKTETKKWDPYQFQQYAQNHNATLTALVPTQVYDLVKSQLTAPTSLRAVIVGGGKLSETVYAQAKELGWPLLPSYGLTECASQVATVAIGSSYKHYQTLSHIQLKTDADGYFLIKSPALLTGYAIQTETGPQFIDPKQEGWFQTEDKGTVSDQGITVIGREGNFIKITGESVDLGRLEMLFQSLQLESKIEGDSALIALPDERLGHTIHLASTANLEQLKPLLNRYQEAVLPVERIRSVYKLDTIPRTALNKLQRDALAGQIKNVTATVI